MWPENIRHVLYINNLSFIMSEQSAVVIRCLVLVVIYNSQIVVSDITYAEMRFRTGLSMS